MPVEHEHPVLYDVSQPTRRRILLTLKILGEATARTLSERLGLTPMGIRRHLNALREEGWVDYRVLRYGRGRPTHVYFLTPKTTQLFDQRYAALTIELLSYLKAEQGEEMISHLFEQRAERRAREALARLDTLPLPQRVVVLATILDEDGYMAEWQQVDGGFVICEHHCAIRDVALAFPQACETELAFIRRVLPCAKVERVEHIRNGDHRCTYKILPSKREKH